LSLAGPRRTCTSSAAVVSGDLGAATAFFVDLGLKVLSET